MSVPDDLSYTHQHEWLRVEGATAVVGVTEYAVEALGDVVFVELPEVGTALTAGETCGEIESTKSVSDLFAPTDGEVVEVNADVVGDPSLVSSNPFGRGWLLKISITGTPDLLDAAAYQHLIQGA